MHLKLYVLTENQETLLQEDLNKNTWKSPGDKQQHNTRPSGQGNCKLRKKGLDPKLEEPRPVLTMEHCPRLTVQETFWPTLGIQVGLVLLAVEAQQTLLVAEMTDLPTPVDGFQQLSLPLTGMAPGSLRALTE